MTRPDLICRAPADVAETPVMVATVLALLLIVAAATDYRRHRLPNSLVVTGAALGIGLQWLLPEGNVWSGLAGLGLGIGLLLPMYWLRTLGAGDVKLMGTVGAFLGPYNVLIAVLCSLLAGGVLALGFAAKKRALGRLFTNLRLMTIGTWLNALVGIREATPPTQSVGTLPYGIAIAAGTTSFLLLRYVGVVP